MTRAATARRLATAAAVAVLAYATPALAHSGGDADPVHTWGPPALFVAGFVLLGASVALDARDVVPARYADVGVGVGVFAVLVAIPWYWL